MELFLRLSIVAIVLFSLLVLVKCLDKTNSTCSFASAKLPHLRLKKYLFCDYNTMVRPIMHHKNATNVTITFTPIRMDFIDESSKFILHTWTAWMWKDEFLSWNPKDFDGITYTYVKSTEIWMPEFTLYNSADMAETQIGVPSTHCVLYSSGFLSCPAPVKYNTHCIADVTHWPYDEQICSIRIDIWIHIGDNVGIDFDKCRILMSEYNKNNEWDITKYFLKNITEYYNCCPPTPYFAIAPTFFLRRHPSMFHTIFVTPAFAFIIITAMVLYLDTESNERILLATVNFVCHMLLIFTFHWVIPQNGEAGSPHLLLFYRDSWMIATFTLVSTVLLRKLLLSRHLLPNWMVFAVSLVENNQICRFLLLDEASNSSDIKHFIGTSSSSPSDVDEENTSIPDSNFQNFNESPAKNSWKKLVKIIQRLAFICVAFTYLLLIILLLPRT